MPTCFSHGDVISLSLMRNRLETSLRTDWRPIYITGYPVRLALCHKANYTCWILQFKRKYIYCVKIRALHIESLEICWKKWSNIRIRHSHWKKKLQVQYWGTILWRKGDNWSHPEKNEQLAIWLHLRTNKYKELHRNWKKIDSAHWINEGKM